MSTFLQKDLTWWNELVFQNEFAGLPMELFEKDSGYDEIWLVEADTNGVTITSMRLRERYYAEFEDTVRDGGGVATALATVTDVWGRKLKIEGTWCRVMIHSNRWITRMIETMNCKEPVGQCNLRQCALSQARYRMHFATHTLRRRTEQTPRCDAHTETNTRGVKQIRPDSRKLRLNGTSLNVRPSQKERLDGTVGTSNSGNPSAPSSASPCGLTNCPGHDKRGWLDYSQRCALQKDTTEQGRETSIRHSKERWQLWHSHIRSFGTAGSITMIRNLSLSLRDTNVPTVKWIGNNQLLHQCCSRCGNS